jgi:hypothetical protein
MKKLLLSLLTLISVSAFAQKDLSIKLLTPMDLTEINSGKGFQVAFTVKNEGLDSVLATDTFFVIINLGNQRMATLVGSRALKSGDSAILSPQGGGMLFTFANDVDSVPFIVGVGFTDTTTVDANDSNNVDFSYVNLRVNHTGLAQTTALANSVSVYPNPATSAFTVSMTATNATVEIMDITGKMIETAAVTMGEVRFDVNNYKNGVYFYQIRDENNAMIKSGKFTVSH